jgi:hypothetical protein
LNQAKILKVQQIASQLTAIASQAANQVLGIVPGMFVPRVIIPPPLIKVPALAPIPITPSIYTVPRTSNAPPSKSENPIASRKGEGETESKQAAWSGGSPAEKNEQQAWGGGFGAEENKQDLPEIKKFSHRERVTSVTNYTCAIEGYEPASYDYESGGPVTYTVNLSILNYETVRSS